MLVGAMFTDHHRKRLREEDEAPAGPVGFTEHRSVSVLLFLHTASAVAHDKIDSMFVSLPSSIQQLPAWLQLVACPETAAAI